MVDGLAYYHLFDGFVTMHCDDQLMTMSLFFACTILAALCFFRHQQILRQRCVRVSLIGRRASDRAPAHRGFVGYGAPSPHDNINSRKFQSILTTSSLRRSTTAQQERQGPLRRERQHPRRRNAVDVHTRFSSIAEDLSPGPSPDLWGEEWIKNLLDDGVVPTCEQVEKKILSGIIPAAVDLDGALRTLNHVSSVDPPYDVSTLVFEDVVNACIDGGRVPEAVAVMALMEGAGKQPDRATCCRVIQACSMVGLVRRRGSWLRTRPAMAKEALKVLQWMETLGYKSDLLATNSVIHALLTGTADDLLVAKRLLLDALRNGSASERDGGEGSKIRDGQRSTQIICSRMIKALTEMLGDQGVDLSLEIICTMRAYGPPPDLWSMNSLLNALALARQPRVRELVNHIHDMRELGPAPDVVSYNSLLKAHARESRPNVESAMSVVDEMRSAGIQPDLVSYTSLLSVCAETKPSSDLTAAATLVRSMEMEGIEPDDATYHCLMQVFANARPVRYKEAITTLNTMEAPTMSAYNIAVNACAKASPARLQEALELRSRMQDLDVFDNEYSLAALLRCCAYSDPPDPGSARRIFTESVINGVATNTHIVSALRKAVGKELASTLLRWASQDRY